MYEIMAAAGTLRWPERTANAVRVPALLWGVHEAYGKLCERDIAYVDRFGSAYCEALIALVGAEYVDVRTGEPSVT